MSYAIDQKLPRFLEQGKAYTLTMPIRTTGGLATVTSGTFSLLDSNGSAVISAAAVTVPQGLATYSMAAAYAAAYNVPEENWRERWTLLIDGVTHKFEHEAMLCRVEPVRYVNEQNLFALHSDWAGFLPPGRSSYDEPIDEAWQQLVRRLLSDKIVPHKILNSWNLVTCHTYWAAHLVCEDFATSEIGNGKWTRLADRYWKRSEREYDRLALKYDEDDDGIPESDELISASPETFLTEVPGDIWGTGGGDY